MSGSAPILLAQGGLRFALEESSLAGLIICGVLVLLSCFSWTVMLTKMWAVHRARKADERFYETFRSAANPLAPFRRLERFRGSSMASVFRSAAQEMSYHLLGITSADENYLIRLQGAGSVTPSQLQGVSVAIERAIAERARSLEGQMTLLATTVSGAPFLGLLGTVWGVMDTFGAVATTDGSSPGLQAMAPGVSAALLTTVVALLVAIPAMFGYNFLVNTIKGMVVRLDNFGAEFLGMLDRLYVDHGRRFDSLPSITSMTGMAARPDPHQEPELPFGDDLPPAGNPPPMIPEEFLFGGPFAEPAPASPGGSDHPPEPEFPPLTRPSQIVP